VTFNVIVSTNWFFVPEYLSIWWLLIGWIFWIVIYFPSHYPTIRIHPQEPHPHLNTRDEMAKRNIHGVSSHADNWLISTFDSHSNFQHVSSLTFSFPPNNQDTPTILKLAGQWDYTQTTLFWLSVIKLLNNIFENISLHLCRIIFSWNK